MVVGLARAKYFQRLSTSLENFPMFLSLLKSVHLHIFILDPKRMKILSMAILKNTTLRQMMKPLSHGVAI